MERVFGLRIGCINGSALDRNGKILYNVNNVKIKFPFNDISKRGFQVMINSVTIGSHLH